MWKIIYKLGFLKLRNVLYEYKLVVIGKIKCMYEGVFGFEIFYK